MDRVAAWRRGQPVRIGHIAFSPESIAGSSPVPSFTGFLSDIHVHRHNSVAISFERYD